MMVILWLEAVVVENLSRFFKQTVNPRSVWYHLSQLFFNVLPVTIMLF